jgi:hypothetical protein
LIDAAVDLAAEPRSLGAKPWILAERAELPRLSRGRE